MTDAPSERLAIFPLPGALLFPRLRLPLHIFEPRYRKMVSQALVSDQRIAMIQPRDLTPVPPLYDVGCVGRIAEVETLEDGRYNLILEGEARFRLVSEIDSALPFRQIEARFDAFDDDADTPLPHILRAEFEQESRRFADSRNILVNWDMFFSLDDEALVNGSAQIAPFDVASKQALLEAPTLVDRADLLIQLLRFFREQGEISGSATLQ